jgi:hypothetical protein
MVAAGLAGIAVIIAVGLIVVTTAGHGAGGGSGGFPTSAPTASATAGTGSPSNVAAPARVAAILDEMQRKAFNPQAVPPKNSAGVPGGIYINWGATWDGSPDTAADNTDFNTNGQTDSQAGLPARHDEFTDLLYLRNLLGYRAQNPADHGFDTNISRMEPVVKSDFQSYTFYKCSLYGELEDMARFAPDQGWGALADAYAQAVLKRFYSASLGSVVDSAHSSYRVDYATECAAMFVDAGKRTGNQTMLAAGISTARHILQNAVDPTTHLLPLQMSVGASGKDAVAQKQVKVGDVAQILDSFLVLYDLTNDSAYRQEVHDAVSWMFSSPIHDQQNGGFFFSVDLDGTNLQSSYKESRQAWMLPLLQHLNRLEPGMWTTQENEMLVVVRDKLWQPVSSGYVFRVTPSFGPFQSSNGPGHAHVTESWVTTEAMDIACQALEGNGS